jgi:rhodanese-related sulfurtransferase
MLFRRVPSISPEQAAARLAAGEITLVDVRESSELRDGRVRGAVHIPLPHLVARVGELEVERPVAFLCRSGARSTRATRIAARAGFDAMNVRGGVIAWSGAGLPLTR